MSPAMSSEQIGEEEEEEKESKLQTCPDRSVGHCFLSSSSEPVAVTQLM